MKGYYPFGLCGYEITIDPENNDFVFAKFVGIEKENHQRRYKIQFTKKGRAFIRPYKHRIYLDEVLTF